jgi:hypothetical protein
MIPPACTADAEVSDSTSFRVSDVRPVGRCTHGDTYFKAIGKTAYEVHNLIVKKQLDFLHT